MMRQSTFALARRMGAGLIRRRQPVGDRLVVMPPERIVAGPEADAFERQLQQLFRGRCRHLIVDLHAVVALDSAGVRALVRGYATARRVDGSLRLAAPQPSVLRVLEIACLIEVFDIYASVEAARLATWPWRTIRIAAAGALLCTALVWIGLEWPIELAGISEIAEGALVAGKKTSEIPVHAFQPFVQVLKLVVATLIGLLVTAIHQPTARERPRSMEQAQTLLCVSGAMMMIIIGNSLARAFGIAGAAGIIKFRTPVDDPKDVTILFLLMGLGMSAGLGAFAVAGLGTAFLCTALLVLNRSSAQRTRVMSVEILATGREFPTIHVEEVFAQNGVVFEPREISQSDDVTVKYHTWLDPRTSLDDLSVQLMSDHAGVRSVTWENPKRERP